MLVHRGVNNSALCLLWITSESLLVSHPLAEFLFDYGAKIQNAVCPTCRLSHMLFVPHAICTKCHLSQMPCFKCRYGQTQFVPKTIRQTPFVLSAIWAKRHLASAIWVKCHLSRPPWVLGAMRRGRHWSQMPLVAAAICQAPFGRTPSSQAPSNPVPF